MRESRVEKCEGEGNKRVEGEAKKIRGEGKGKKSLLSQIFIYAIPLKCGQK